MAAPNMREAVRLYTLSANQEYDLAQFNLANCYEKGIGVEQPDLDKAKKWYRLAADQKNSGAIKALKRLERL